MTRGEDRGKGTHLVLVESQQDERSIIIELGVGEQRSKEVVDPVSEESVGGVVS